MRGGIDADGAGGEAAAQFPSSGIRQSSCAWLLVGGASALALFVLSHPYRGILHDADLYVGRALADADPARLGRDIVFAHDGQSGFSLYPGLSAAWIGLVGPATGALTLTLAGLLAWFAGAAAFAATLARGRVLWAALVTTAVVPGFYGDVFRYAEPFATPRPFAEAAALAGLAALAVGRAWPSLAVLLLAAAIHPIMAAPALAIWCIVRIAQDRRWLLLPAFGLAALLVAASAGLPLAARLVTIMDAEWLSAVSANAYLLPSQWRDTTWAGAAIRAATILLALPFVAPGPRRVLAGILAAAILGLAITWLAADRFVLVLTIQGQAWRALWLLGVAGAVVLPVASVGLWRSGPQGRLALALLALGWIFAPTSLWAAAAAGGAALVWAAKARLADSAAARLQKAGWAAALAASVLMLAPRTGLVWALWTSKPADAPILGQVWLFWVPAFPIVAAAIALAVHERWRPALLPAALLALLLAGLALANWDDRSRLDRITDARRPDPALVSLLPPGADEVLWLRNGARYAWALAGRPNWVSYVQGAPMVFSADLARIWGERMGRLLAAGLGDGHDRSPWTGGREILRPSLARIRAFCAAPDAPVAIIAPRDGSVVLPAGLEAAPYRLPAPLHELSEGGTGLGWQQADAFDVVPCRTDGQA